MDRKLKTLFELYFQSGKNYELETKFGVKNSLSKMDFDNIIKILKDQNFTCDSNNGNYHLNIQNQFVDRKTGKTHMSNIRTEIYGIKNIQLYCKRNIFDLDNPPNYIKFLQKKPVFLKDKRIFPLDYNDFDFRVNIKEEKYLNKKDGIIKGTLRDWSIRKKTFRYIKRFTFRNENVPFKIDCSIVKSSKRGVRNKYTPAYNIQDSDVFNQFEGYEVEIEMLPAKELQGPMLNFINKFKLAWKYILSGIQSSVYPISYTERNMVLQNYKKLLYANLKKKKQKSGKKRLDITRRDFVGPSPISLQFINIIVPSASIMEPNIRVNYTVTEKADGIRKLLYIGDGNVDGKIYLIDTNMNVQYTGTSCQVTSLYNTIIDGEHVLYDKLGNYINRYLAFDLYYKSGRDFRQYPFVRGGDIKYKAELNNKIFRLNLLNDVIGELELNKSEVNNFTVLAKTFYTTENNSNPNIIFENCDRIWRNVNTEFDYEVDGLIFTPSNTGVNSNIAGEITEPVKKTWKYALKWKPSKYNTVDFLVKIKKNENGEDFIGNIFEGGNNLEVEEQLYQYKTLILRVGFDENVHGFLNPCHDIIMNTFPKRSGKYDRNRYRPQSFYPTNPSDSNAHLCNIILQDSSLGGSKYLFTENKEDTFEDNMIVEFRYDMDRDKCWRWIPIRVRYDKTEDLRKTGKNFGNAYHVAEGVWKTIHHPITDKMIRTGKDIPENNFDENVYYSRKSNKSQLTRALRDFHNYIKRILITGVSQPGQTLIDLAVGKGGDLPKWIAAHLSFIFGIDISKDNIENRFDGACARYIKKKQQYKIMPAALFVTGNSALNIKNYEYCKSENCKKITAAIMGKGEKDKSKLGTGIYNQYGKGENGFDIVSCQFAIHYFFQNKVTLNGFLRNVCENCKVGGYFIGTCLDGNKIYELLEEKDKNESHIILKDKIKMWEVTKMYNSNIDEFKNDETSLGYSVGIYQESIGSIQMEYLVNFEFLKDMLEKYGFNMISSKDVKLFDLPNHSGLFNELFLNLEDKIESGILEEKHIGKSLRLSDEEKQLSYMTRYFVFKKKHKVNADEIYSHYSK